MMRVKKLKMISNFPISLIKINYLYGYTEINKKNKSVSFRAYVDMKIFSKFNIHFCINWNPNKSDELEDSVSDTVEESDSDYQDSKNEIDKINDILVRPVLRPLRYNKTGFNHNLTIL